LTKAFIAEVPPLVKAFREMFVKEKEWRRLGIEIAPPRVRRGDF
jgi:hypothetical protein